MTIRPFSVRAIFVLVWIVACPDLLAEPRFGPPAALRAPSLPSWVGLQELDVPQEPNEPEPDPDQEPEPEPTTQEPEPLEEPPTPENPEPLEDPESDEEAGVEKKPDSAQEPDAEQEAEEETAEEQDPEAGEDAAGEAEDEEEFEDWDFEDEEFDWESDFEPPPPDPDRIRGGLALRYLYRNTNLDRRDQDLYAYFSLNLGSARHDGVTASLYARAAHDLEGDVAGGIGRSLSSLPDGTGRTTDWKLYRAFVAFHDVLGSPGSEIRVGRQSLYDTPLWINFDGGLAEFPVDLFGLRGRFDVYAGQPEHYWESSPDGDRIAGTALDLSPWKGGFIRLDAMRLHDSSRFGDAQNDLFGVRVGHATEIGLWGNIGWTYLDNRTRDITATGIWQDPDLDLRVHANGRFLFSRQTANTLEFDRFERILMAEEPFQEGQLMVSKGFELGNDGERVQVDLGVFARGLRDSSDASEFNREYERYWVAATLENLFVDDVSLSVTGQTWDSGTDRITNAAAEVNAQLLDNLRATVGTAYALYKYDFFAAFERDEVYDYFGRFRYEVTDDLRLIASFTYQDDQTENFVIASFQAEVDF